MRSNAFRRPSVFVVRILWAFGSAVTAHRARQVPLRVGTVIPASYFGLHIHRAVPTPRFPRRPHGRPSGSHDGTSGMPAWLGLLWNLGAVNGTSTCSIRR